MRTSLSTLLEITFFLSVTTSDATQNFFAFFTSFLTVKPLFFHSLVLPVSTSSFHYGLQKKMYQILSVKIIISIIVQLSLSFLEYLWSVQTFSHICGKFALFFNKKCQMWSYVLKFVSSNTEFGRLLFTNWWCCCNNNL